MGIIWVPFFVVESVSLYYKWLSMFWVYPSGLFFKTDYEDCFWAAGCENRRCVRQDGVWEYLLYPNARKTVCRGLLDPFSVGILPSK